MGDFSSWDEVKRYLESGNNCVLYSRSSYSSDWKECSDGCCTDSFPSVDKVIDQLREDCRDRLDLVEGDWIMSPS